ncbi:MAG: V-type ATP synthase subunit K [Actinomycetia bacterium]|nr:V-type ATP synthase subunit K [Actinomycetes bacterium]
MKRKIFTGAGKASLVMFMTIGLVLVPALALAAEATAAAPSGSSAAVARYLAAGGTMAIAAISAAFAQAKIGTAAAGTIAERPETATMMIVLQALPEIIVLLGFVTSLLIVNAA